MELIKPDFEQNRPTSAQAQAMCQQLLLESRPLLDPRFHVVLKRLRENYANGGAFLVSYRVGFNEAFDWFASRNRLQEFGVLRQLFDRSEIRNALPDLLIEPLRPGDPALVVHKAGEYGPVEPALAAFGIGEDFEISNHGYEGEFQDTSPFLFDGELAQALYAGGAYTSAEGDGRTEKENSLAFCNALFDLRFSEVSYYSSHSPWTPWFGNISLTWDWTAILFDRRTRTLSILVTTDTD